MGRGPVTAEKLHGRGITTVGEVAGLPEPVLVAMLGPASGHKLHALAHNRDPRRVRPGPRRSSIGSQSALGPAAPGLAELDAVLIVLIDRVCLRPARGQPGLPDRAAAAISFDHFRPGHPVTHAGPRRLPTPRSC